MKRRVGEDGENVFEENAGRRKVGELAEGLLEFLLEVDELVHRTGLLGGAGKMVSHMRNAFWRVHEGPQAIRLSYLAAGVGASPP